MTRFVADINEENKQFYSTAIADMPCFRETDCKGMVEVSNG